jgi:hypothetical protein
MEYFLQHLLSILVNSLELLPIAYVDIALGAVQGDNDPDVVGLVGHEILHVPGVDVHLVLLVDGLKLLGKVLMLLILETGDISMHRDQF